MIKENNFSIPDSGFSEALKNIESERNIKKDTENNQEKEIVPFQESLKLANELLARYDKEIRANMGKNIDGWSELIFTDFQKSIKHFTQETPEEILTHFQGHGITKFSHPEQLAAALNIMANKAIKGYCGQLGGPSNLNAYTRGDFLVLSKYDKTLPVQDEKGEGKFNEIGWMADIGAFVIDVKYYLIVEELKKMFPDINIIKANELPQYLKKNNEQI
jgi:hypothetical protein